MFETCFISFLCVPQGYIASSLSTHIVSRFGWKCPLCTFFKVQYSNMVLWWLQFETVLVTVWNFTTVYHETGNRFMPISKLFSPVFHGFKVPSSMPKFLLILWTKSSIRIYPVWHLHLGYPSLRKPWLKKCNSFLIGLNRQCIKCIWIIL